MCAFQDNAAAFDAVQGTHLCEKIVEFLNVRFQSILEMSEELDVGQVDEIKVNWLEAHHLLRPPSTTPPVSVYDNESRDANENFPGKVLPFLSIKCLKIDRMIDF